jgi:selenocysteine lyase/cysteine desulfurase
MNALSFIILTSKPNSSFMHKRTFLKSITLAGLGLPQLGKSNTSSLISIPLDPAPLVAKDEKFWKSVRALYKIKSDYINLESGYYNMLPEETLEQYMAIIKEVNYHASFYMRTRQFKERAVQNKLIAQFLGGSEDEIVLTRNTTESLDLIISGYPWQTGDEAIFAEQDYGAMIDMFKQVAKRHGVVNKMVSIPNIPQSDEEIVSIYEKAITPKTKLIMICHIINITGQILPVKKICDMAHKHGVEVMVDGAHAVAQIQFNINELGCDYYGASLHKWLAVPLGVGVLYVKKEHQSKIWPLIGENESIQGINRLNHFGTNPVHTYLALQFAINFHEKIGAANKEERLRFLQQYWTSKVASIPNIILNTPTESKRSCAIANVGIKGLKPAEMAETLLKKYRIYTVAIDSAGVHGCRITPNVFTTLEDLDKFVNALKEMAA